MRTLTRYVGRDVLFATLTIFAALLSLFAFFDLINELSDVGKDGYTISSAMLYVALHLPSRIYELFPVAALIGTLFAIALVDRFLQVAAGGSWEFARPLDQDAESAGASE